MSDEQTTSTDLPDPVRTQNIRLLWLPWGVEPLTSCEGGKEFNTLKGAVDEALAEYKARRDTKHNPWIRSGTGAGAAVFGVQGILLLKAAWAEGAAR